MQQVTSELGCVRLVQRANGFAECPRADQRPEQFAVPLWPLRLRDLLPKIPVPLRSPDPDASIDLKAILDRVYDAAGYEDYLYKGRPQFVPTQRQ